MSIAIGAVVLLSIPWYHVEYGRPSRPIISGKVVRVVDGDTLDVTGIGRVRLVGVNTPEKDERGYGEATAFLEERCLGEKVELDIDDLTPRDHYGRLLAVAYVDGENVNALLLRSGHAEVLSLPPSEFDPREWLSEPTPAVDQAS